MQIHEFSDEILAAADCAGNYVRGATYELGDAMNDYICAQCRRPQNQGAKGVVDD